MMEVTEEAGADELQEDEPIEELYTTLGTSVVGIQYYEGYMRQTLDQMTCINTTVRSYRIRRAGEARTGTK